MKNKIEFSIINGLIITTKNNFDLINSYIKNNSKLLKNKLFTLARFAILKCNFSLLKSIFIFCFRNNLYDEVKDILAFKHNLLFKEWYMSIYSIKKGDDTYDYYVHQHTSIHMVLSDVDYTNIINIGIFILKYMRFYLLNINIFEFINYLCIRYYDPNIKFNEVINIYIKIYSVYFIRPDIIEHNINDLYPINCPKVHYDWMFYDILSYISKSNHIYERLYNKYKMLSHNKDFLFYFEKRVLYHKLQAILT